ncbi:MAG: ribosomal protein L7Ae/L30e/S12e/Gadd45 [Candidatus Parvarchaeum acidiphilum ARMAN-4]|jgi:ribosomal protein L30E|uniref:Ribosomal protein L7Ae/L30e/S12e/Gadd45 n=1 Tax=Candidatus Parvarchaeum acidiphilum ARMAN-4 TaxID=662760 RepID=D2EG02_PARA4|nr:MAG: ribosomal protein L7Ae/L30e/S12e/Gadd45 [Candidatus Parvarchaeum acidiphilum ARMAN-4]MCL5976207.1 ribosomal L7Ae/L30e/S12e/Gadd45 family protein [Candidatus Parvarchaeota archaeon]
MEKEIAKKIQEKIKSNKVFIGLNSTLRAYKEGDISFIVYASNASDVILEKLNSLDTEKYKYDGDSDALSIACGKSFGITVLGIKK